MEFVCLRTHSDSSHTTGPSSTNAEPDGHSAAATATVISRSSEQTDKRTAEKAPRFEKRTVNQTRSRRLQHTATRQDKLMTRTSMDRENTHLLRMAQLQSLSNRTTPATIVSIGSKSASQTRQSFVGFLCRLEATFWFCLLSTAHGVALRCVRCGCARRQLQPAFAFSRPGGPSRPTTVTPPLRPSHPAARLAGHSHGVGEDGGAR